jgi:hypothetical protein
MEIYKSQNRSAARAYGGARCGAHAAAEPMSKPQAFE